MPYFCDCMYWIVYAMFHSQSLYSVVFWPVPLTFAIGNCACQAICLHNVQTLQHAARVLMSWFAVSQMECKRSETKECCVPAQSLHSRVHGLLHEKIWEVQEKVGNVCHVWISYNHYNLLTSGKSCFTWPWMLPPPQVLQAVALAVKGLLNALWSAIHLKIVFNISTLREIPDSRLPSKSLGTMPLASYVRKQTRK